MTAARSFSARWQRFLENSSFIREYLWRYRRLVAVGLLALILVDILEVLPPILLKEAIDIAVDRRPLALLGYVAAGYVVVAILQGFCRYGWRMYLLRSSLFSGRDLRDRFTSHLFTLPATFYDRKPVGDLMSLATSDVEAVRAMIGAGLLTLADAIFYFMTVPVAMYLLSPKLMLIAFLPLPIIPWLVMRNQREIHARFEKTQEAFGEISSVTQEALNGIRVTKAFAKEDAQARRFRRVGENYVARALKLARVNSSFGPILDFTMSFGLVALLYIGGRQLIGTDPASSAAISLGTFVAFERYVQKMVWPMAALGLALSSYQKAVTSSARLKEVLRSTTDVPESTQPALPAGALALEAVASGWRTPGRVEFRKLSFRFPRADTNALTDVSLTIEAGERVAFLGTVGSGKSALLSLLPRLYPVGRGMLFVDGIDINDWPLEELRRQVGYVGQDVFLFSETVLENIAYGLAFDAREEQPGAGVVEEASQLACVHDDVLGLSSAYKTRVGERGVNLSGGQKQRLTIARAIIKKPSILILDDALSSVDVQTEERILRGLRAREGRNTEIIAAHRISTIRDADRIVVLEGGLVRQVGRHAELVEDRRGTYRRFYEQQQLKADLESYSEKLAEKIEKGTVSL